MESNSEGSFYVDEPGLRHFPHNGEEVLFRDLVVQIVRDSVLALGTRGEDVPGEEIDLNAAVGGGQRAFAHVAPRRLQTGR
jgi:hypothetical protein